MFIESESDKKVHITVTQDHVIVAIHLSDVSYVYVIARTSSVHVLRVHPEGKRKVQL